MTDTVTATTVFNSPRKLIRHLTNRSDGTGESNVVKLDRSAFTGPDGTEPGYLVIEKIVYDVSSMRVLLTWDHTTDEVIAVLQGHGVLDWRSVGGLKDTEAGGDGDILLTTANQASGDGYDITLYVRKKD